MRFNSIKKILKNIPSKKKFPIVVFLSVLVVIIVALIITFTSYREHNKQQPINTVFSEKLSVKKEANSSDLRYKKSGKSVVILGFKDNSPDYTLLSIPDEIDGKPVVEIADSAFKDNGVLETVIFGKNIKKINKSAFENCSALKAVALRNTTEFVGPDAFNGCVSLRSVTLNDSLKYLYSGCFKNTALSMIYIPSSVELIEDAFPENTVISGQKGSYARNWAKENNFQFKESY